MIDNDDFRTLRRYRSEEVVALLGLKKTWLKRWVTSHTVPHHRSGEERGVWFTYDDIIAIGRMLPQLMTGTQANRRAEATESAGPADPVLHAQAAAPVTEQALADFASLVSLRA